MSDNLPAIIASGVITLISGFGSILLKDHLDRRREERRSPPAAAAPVPAASPSPSPSPADRTERTERPAPVAAPPMPARHRSSYLASASRVVSVIAVGAIVGVILGPVHDGPATALLIGSLFVVSLLMLVFYLGRKNRSALGYQFSVLTLWAAFAATYIFGRGYIPWGDTVVPTLGFWLATAVVGLLAFAVTRKRSLADPA